MIEDYVNPQDVFTSLKDEGFSENEKGQIIAIQPLLSWPQLVPKQHIAIHTGMPIKHLLDLGLHKIDAMPLNWDALLVSDVTQSYFTCTCNDHQFNLSETEIYIHSERYHLFVGFLINTKIES